MNLYSTLLQALGGQVVAIFLIGFAALMGIALVYLSAQHRRSTLQRDRQGRTEETFVDFLEPYGFDPEIARLVYRYLQEHERVAFPILPADELDRDLGLNDEEVQHAVEALLRQAGRDYLPGLLASPLVTVVDLIRYVQASPRRSSQTRRIG